MSKRDNPRFKERETEKKKKPSATSGKTYGAASKSQKTSAQAPRPGKSAEGSRSSDRPSRPSEGYRSSDRPSRPSEGYRSSDRPSRPSEGYRSSDRPSRPSEGSRSSDRPSRPSEGFRSSGRPSKPSEGFRSSVRPARHAESYRSSDRPCRSAEGYRSSEKTFENPNMIIGRNPVMEAIKCGRTIDRILMQKDGEGSIKKIASMAREKNIQIQYVEKIVLDKLCPGRPHQGIAAFAAVHDYVDVDFILKAAQSRGEDPFIILLDGLEDPHNLGAILRSADGAGAHGVVIPSRRAVGLTESVAKASAGAIEYIPVAKVANIAQTMDELKKKGLWITGLDMDGTHYSQAELKGPIALVVGGEGRGVSRLIREKCDHVVSIPMKGKIESLNASNAAAILMYEIQRQRDL